MADPAKPQKDIFFTEKISRMFKELKTFTKDERLQYRVDTKALLCRGLEPNEQKRIQYGLYAEDGFHIASRLYVPLALFSLYRRGMFNDAFSFTEFKHIIRITLFMQLIDLSGHALLRYISKPVVHKYVSENELAMLGKKKKFMNDYLSQKNYFKNKKDAKEYTT